MISHRFTMIRHSHHFFPSPCNDHQLAVCHLQVAAAITAVYLTLVCCCSPRKRRWTWASCSSMVWSRRSTSRGDGPWASWRTPGRRWPDSQNRGAGDRARYVPISLFFTKKSCDVSPVIRPYPAPIDVIPLSLPSLPLSPAPIFVTTSGSAGGQAEQPLRGRE